MCFILFVLIVSKNLNKDMKFFSHFSLQFKNIILILHRQKQTMGYGVMVTLQILVLSFLVRIQVAQLKTIFVRRSFFLLWPPPSLVCMRWRLTPLLRCYWFADASTVTNNTTTLQAVLVQTRYLPHHSLLSIVEPPDSHFCLVEPI